MGPAGQEAVDEQQVLPHPVVDVDVEGGLGRHRQTDFNRSMAVFQRAASPERGV